MTRRASFWSFLDGGACRLCRIEGRDFRVVDLDRVRGRGDSLRARNRVINHMRGWHPSWTENVVNGAVLSISPVAGPLMTWPEGMKVDRAT